MGTASEALRGLDNSSLQYSIQYTYAIERITYSHHNLTFFSIKMLIYIPHETWSAQVVRESKIDHTNAIYPHSTEPKVRNSAISWH